MTTSPATPAGTVRRRSSHVGSAPTPRARAVSRRAASVAVGLLFALTSVFTLAVPRRDLRLGQRTFSSSSESELVALTNRARASAGLKALKVDSTLTSVARWRSKDMIDRDYFSHTIPGYGKVWDKLDAIGYCYKVAGENIGWNNYPDDVATAAIQQMFMDSAGHRANILGKAWDVIGIGAYKGPTGKKMWTVLFADKCGSTAPKPTPKPTRRSRPPRPTPRPTPKPAPRADAATDPEGGRRRRRSRPRRRPPDARAPSRTPRRRATTSSCPTTAPVRRPTDGRAVRRRPRPRRTTPRTQRRRAARRRRRTIGWSARDDRRRRDRVLLRRLN